MSEKKKKVQWRLEWATAHFLFVLSHDTVECIVTQSAQKARMDRKDRTTIWPSTAITRRSWAATRLARERNTAHHVWHGVLYCDTGFVSRQGDSARVSWISLSCVMIQFLYHDRRAA